MMKRNCESELNHKNKPYNIILIFSITLLLIIVVYAKVKRNFKDTNDSNCFH
jgi:hypothetical protein